MHSYFFLYLTWKCEKSALKHFVITYFPRMTLFLLKEIQMILDKNIKSVTRSLDVMRKHYTNTLEGSRRRLQPLRHT